MPAKITQRRFYAGKPCTPKALETPAYPDLLFAATELQKGFWGEDGEGIGDTAGDEAEKVIGVAELDGELLTASGGVLTLVSNGDYSVTGDVSF